MAKVYQHQGINDRLMIPSILFAVSILVFICLSNFNLKKKNDTKQKMPNTFTDVKSLPCL